MKLAEKQSLYVKAKDQYYNSGDTGLTDQEFDALEDSLRSKVPDWEEFKRTGVKVGKKFERTLDVPMPSLDKIQDSDTEALSKWVEKFASPSAMVSPKFDGSSLQVTYVDGKARSLITRGDGVDGKDVTFLLPYINLPKTILTKTKVSLRLEAIMKNSVYQKKYSGEFDSARALASSVFNRQDPSLMLRDIDLVVLRVLDNSSIVNLKGFCHLNGFASAPGLLLKKGEITTERLAGALNSVKSRLDYELDGLVLFCTASYLEITGERPKYAKAFKVNDHAGALQTTILRIDWNKSAFGVLVPKAIISPVKFGNVTVKQAALHNASWLLERKAGVGAVVKVIRSGDIIPKIVEVIKPAKVDLPDKNLFGDYEWDSNHTKLVCSEADPVKIMARFFSHSGMDSIAGALAKKLVLSGCTSTHLLPSLTLEDIQALPGVKSSAPKIFAQLQSIKKMPVSTLMAASGCFEAGLGRSRLALLPKSCKSKDTGPDLGALAEVSGLGPAFADLYGTGFKNFKSWMVKAGLDWIPDTKKKPLKTGSLSGKSFAWTGYRSQSEEDFIADNGGTLDSSLKASTSYLFYRQDGKSSGKVLKAGDRAVVFTKFREGLSR